MLVVVEKENEIYEAAYEIIRDFTLVCFPEEKGELKEFDALVRPKDDNSKL